MACARVQLLLLQHLGVLQRLKPVEHLERLHGYTTDFRYSIVMLVSLDFSPKGNFKHETIFVIDHYLDWMQCWFELPIFGPWAYDTYGWEGWSMAKVNQINLCAQ